MMRFNNQIRKAKMAGSSHMYLYFPGHSFLGKNNMALCVPILKVEAHARVFHNIMELISNHSTALN